MHQVTVHKKDLLEILKKNRNEHRAIFLEVQKAFRAAAIEALDAQLKAAREGKPFELRRLVHLVMPEDHTADYDRSILMLEMSVDQTIDISGTEFQNYVQDEWSWSRGWAESTMPYVDRKTRGYDKLAALVT